ncbi:MAG: hypothetical protein AAFR26_26745 [Cyanobacteria bacterium J06626_4]
MTLTYLAANPHPEKPSFVLMTNWDDSIFVKLAQTEERQYNFSRAFAALASHQELEGILQGLKQLGRVVAS